MKNCNVSVFVDYYQAGLFFLEVASKDKSRNYVFFTPLLSVYFFAKRRGFKVVLLTHRQGKYLTLESLKDTREFVSGSLSNIDIINYANGTVSHVHSCGLKFEYSLCWNGTDILGEVSRYLKDNGVVQKTIFCEISNLPGLLFKDPVGVNAKSSLMIEKKWYSDGKYNEIHDRWISDYIVKKSNKLPPQAMLIKKVSPRLIMDIPSVLGLTLLKYSKEHILNKLKFKFFRKKIKFDFPYENVSEDYVFFPMQVSDDSQLLLNSDVNNVEAIIKILTIEKGTVVVVKPHPAEQNINFINEVISRFSDKVVFSKHDTFDLISRSKRVYTINSTVGLEARLLGKDVTFFGKSPISNFNQQDIQYYIHEYLINIDFFDPLNINVSEVEKLYI
ncbi:hypothetical protein AB4082_21275 [Vibrio cyclitrophicus]